MELGIAGRVFKSCSAMLQKLNSCTGAAIVQEYVLCSGVRGASNCPNLTWKMPENARVPLALLLCDLKLSLKKVPNCLTAL